METSNTKEYKNLGFKESDVKPLVATLNKLLANYHVHYQKLRNYHWNVKGEDFFDIHEKFEVQYNKAKENIDEIAERVRVYGATPVSTMKQFLEISEIKETGSDLKAHDMVMEIKKDMEILDSFMYDAVDASIEAGDSALEDMLKTYIADLEKDHWMWSAFLSN
ncbi:Dps family protein [Marinigracilibium pacificum]|uniref:DNA starvation/stationary phase protection protein n=1 Tax=Marinigracilibium pacificum TaxID=2729599 RepID=A0A848J272_9BACT|nr:DNA starvation/stationary phase protection protein [Marinigracilibium pacificum]NMM49886.1 DNA starvation/stationary phase protection protein [Marinigracilibium pacificum]